MVNWLGMSRKVSKKAKNNTLFISLPVFLKALKFQPPMGTYQHFNKLKESSLFKENLSKYVQRYLDAYYLTPLMVRSIFENLVQELIAIKKFETAFEITQKLKSIKPEYNFRRIFGDYENRINKLKLEP